MAEVCSHEHLVRDVTPSADGCEECLKTGDWWVHLRLCRICGHVGCCDDSPNRHARAHFHATGHPVIEGYDPPEGWAGAGSTRCSSTSATARRRIRGRSQGLFEAMGEPTPYRPVYCTRALIHKMRPAAS
jgi:hypothetical protein